MVHYLNRSLLPNLADFDFSVDEPIETPLPTAPQIFPQLPKGFMDVIGADGGKIVGEIRALYEKTFPEEEARSSDGFLAFIEALGERFDRVVLRQQNIVSRMQDRLGDPTFADSMEQKIGKDLKAKQRRFLKYLNERMLSGNARTGFAKYPTGVGKTWMMGLLSAAAYDEEKPPRILVLSPRDVVNEQNAGEIKQFLPDSARIGEVGSGSTIEIGTYQLGAQNRVEGGDFGKYDIILLDELHRGFGAGFLEFIRTHHPNALIVGFSATPYIGNADKPGNMKSAPHFFECEIDSVSLPEACTDGDITPIRAVRLSTREVFSGEERSDEELNEKMDTATRTAMAVKIAGLIPTDETGLVFCKDTTHADEVYAALKESGFEVGVVHSKMDQGAKDQAFLDFKEGRTQFLVSAEMLIEGFDNKKASHAIVLRLTKSLWLYEQMIGRACRLDPSNPNKIATIWDVVGQHSGQCTLHGIARLYGLLSEIPFNGEVLFPPSKQTDGAEREKPAPEDWRSALASIAGYTDVVTIDSIDMVLIPRDETYYMHAEYVKADLDAYALAGDCSLADLAGNSPDGRMRREKLNVSASLSNGETDVSLRSYCRQYAQLRSCSLREALCLLIATAGYPVPEMIDPIDEEKEAIYEHLENADMVQADLSAFVEANGWASARYIDIAKARTASIIVGTRSVRFLRYIALVVDRGEEQWNWPAPVNGGLMERVNLCVHQCFGEKLIQAIPEKTYYTDPQWLRLDWQRAVEAGVDFGRQGYGDKTKFTTHRGESLLLRVYVEKMVSCIGRECTYLQAFHVLKCAGEDTAGVKSFETLFQEMLASKVAPVKTVPVSEDGALQWPVYLTNYVAAQVETSEQQQRSNVRKLLFGLAEALGVLTPATADKKATFTPRILLARSVDILPTSVKADLKISLMIDGSPVNLNPREFLFALFAATKIQLSDLNVRETVKDPGQFFANMYRDGNPKIFAVKQLVTAALEMLAPKK